MMRGKDETRMDVFQYTQKKEKRKQRNKDAVGVQNERQACAVTTVQRQCQSLCWVRDARRRVGVSAGESHGRTELSILRQAAWLGRVSLIFSSPQETILNLHLAF